MLCTLALTAACQYVGLGGMDDYGADVVRVGLKHLNLLQRIIIEHSHHHIILCMDNTYCLVYNCLSVLVAKLI